MWKLDGGSTALARRLAAAAGLGLLALATSSCQSDGGCVGITSCLTAYRLPSPDSPSAEISVDLDQTRSPGVQSQQVSISDNASMTGARTLAVVWKQFYPSHVDTRVAAGQRIFLRAHAKRPISGTSYVACFNIVSFTPQTGAAYDVFQPVVGNGCVLEVRDRASGQQVADYQRHDAGAGLPLFL